MFGHIFINRCKCLVRDTGVMFWTFMFPIILASLFALAFNNLSSADRLGAINIAVVNNHEYQNNHGFQTALSSVSKSGTTGDAALFDVRLGNRQETDGWLKDNNIDGYIVMDSGPHLAVRQSGIKQAIVQEFLDDYMQKSSTLTAIIKQNPQSGKDLLAAVKKSHNYIKAVSPTNAEPNTTLNYFFALVAMACLYGSYWGVKEVSTVQADLSPQGARVSLAPFKKSRLLGPSLCAATVVHLLSIFILVAYLSLVLKVDFGNDLLYVLLTCVLGSITGILMGALIGVIIKKGEAAKTAVLISISLVLSFLAGLMIVDMKYIVTNAVPVMAYLNPANLITDAFYSLYYYDTYSRFYTNIGLLVVFILVFYLAIYLITRRQRYASL